MDEDRPKARVLIVDDDEGIRAALRDCLEAEGYGVIEAPDGVVALDVLRALPYPIIVLSNHNMPRLDGPGLFDTIANEPALAARHSFLYMTANNRVLSPTFAHQLEGLGAPTIRKPFDLDRVLDAVAEAARKLTPEDGEGGDPAPEEPLVERR